jgi:hypothetical protein
VEWLGEEQSEGEEEDDDDGEAATTGIGCSLAETVENHYGVRATRMRAEMSDGQRKKSNDQKNDEQCTLTVASQRHETGAATRFDPVDFLIPSPPLEPKITMHLAS